MRDHLFRMARDYSEVQTKVNSPSYGKIQKSNMREKLKSKI